MRKKLTILIPFKPVPASRPKVTFKPIHKVYYSKSHNRYKKLLEEFLAIQKHTFLYGAIGIKLEFYIKPPTQWTTELIDEYGDDVDKDIFRTVTKADKEFLEDKLAITHADYDNFAKLVSDCLTGLYFKDDRQIAKANIVKRYSKNPRTMITLIGKAKGR